MYTVPYAIMTRACLCGLVWTLAAWQDELSMAMMSGVGPGSEANLWPKLEEDNDSLQYRPLHLPLST
jgi:hypothetical protein